jgi:hypothetical protein
MEGTMPKIINMKGTRPNAADYGGHPAPMGLALTNDLCSQYFKIKVKTSLVLTLTLTLTF